MRIIAVIRTGCMTLREYSNNVFNAEENSHCYHFKHCVLLTNNSAHNMGYPIGGGVPPSLTIVLQIAWSLVSFPNIAA